MPLLVIWYFAPGKKLRCLRANFRSLLIINREGGSQSLYRIDSINSLKMSDLLLKFDVSFECVSTVHAQTQAKCPRAVPGTARGHRWQTYHATYIFGQ